jgi:hypothetical protein
MTTAPVLCRVPLGRLDKASGSIEGDLAFTRQPHARVARRRGSAILVAAAALLSATCLAVAPATAQADLVVNGGFETGCSAEFCSPEPPWAQLYHGVDVVNASFFAPHSGTYSVDLNSYATGGIIQNLATTAGHQYTLSFWMAGNPDPNKNSCSTDGKTYAAIYKLNLIWGGTTIDSPIFDNSKEQFNATNMGWTQHTYTVTAASSTTSLEFDSVEPGGPCGPTIDDVSVVPTVEAHWYSNGRIITEGLAEPVSTKGSLTFLYVASAPKGESAIKCKVKDKETIENPMGGGAGVDKLTEFALSACKAKPSPCSKGAKTEIVPRKLPWATHLIAGPPIRDVLERIEVEVKCGGMPLATFTGSLVPTIGSSVLEFGGASGELKGPGGSKVTVTGTDKLKGPKGDTKVTAKTP